MIVDVGQLLVDSSGARDSRNYTTGEPNVRSAICWQDRNHNLSAQVVTTLSQGSLDAHADDKLIRQQKPRPTLGDLEVWSRAPSVNAARLCKVLQLAEFKVTFTGCGGRYSQLFHSFCGKRKGVIHVR